MRLVHYFLRVVLLLLTAFCFSTDTCAADVETDSFAKVRQVFVKNCVSCHSEAAKIRGGLDLTTAEKVLAGGSSGPAVVPGRATESLMIQMVQLGRMPHMPPKGQLLQDEIETLTRWVDGISPVSYTHLTLPTKRIV